MSRLLLDTHALIWALADNDRLSAAAAMAIEAPDTELLVSVASLWEIAIKYALGKLTLDVPLQDLLKTLEERSIALLSITARDALCVAELPPHHKDPFDRLLAV